MAETMGLVCMAEAQAVIGFRAESKGSLPGTVASLMVGASGNQTATASVLFHGHVAVFKVLLRVGYQTFVSRVCGGMLACRTPQAIAWSCVVGKWAALPWVLIWLFLICQSQ